MLTQSIIPYFKQFDSHAWRKKVCWKEEIDLVFKKSLKLLKQIYGKFSGRYANPGAPKFMSLSEFSDMLMDAPIFTKEFNLKIIPQLYNLSMLTQVDEIDNDRHLNMVFTEFLEALVRVAEKLEVPHLIEVS
jgi:hypothetical protein